MENGLKGRKKFSIKRKGDEGRQNQRRVCESRSQQPGVEVREKWEVTLSWARSFVWGDENVLERVRGGSCTTL